LSLWYGSVNQEQQHDFYEVKYLSPVPCFPVLKQKRKKTCRRPAIRLLDVDNEVSYLK